MLYYLYVHDSHNSGINFQNVISSYSKDPKILVQCYYSWCNVLCNAIKIMDGGIYNYSWVSMPLTVGQRQQHGCVPKETSHQV